MTVSRVYEFAKAHNMSSKAVLELAKKNGIEFNSHMSSMTEGQTQELERLLRQPKAAPAEKAAQKPKQDKPAPKAKPEAKQSHKQPESKGQNQAHQGNKQAKKPHGQESAKKHEGQAKAKPEGNRHNGQQPNNQNQRHNQADFDSNRRGGGSRRKNRGRHNRQNANVTESKGITARKHKELPEKLVYTEGMNIQEIAKLFHRDASEIIKKLLMLGVMANQNQALSKEVIELIAMEDGVEAEEKVVIDNADLERHFAQEEIKPENLVTRPPVVTIMGHVDHGKTTLLDQLRNTNVSEGEAGGITQHIGAYQVKINDKLITFLDTPGHEAFTTMRARGADVTDITIIVVAADDGVMPQTVEAINHAKAADVPIIVAINKIDKPGANPDRVMQELTEHGLIPEAWGGETIFVPISAKFNQNIEELLEMILLVSEVEELKADPQRLAIGTVIEARLDKSQGSTATLLVQQGTLHVGDPIVVGNAYGKVRTMVNDAGRRIRQAGPATPVEITGLNDAPQAGDLFVVFPDEKSARAAGEERAKRALLKQRQATHRVSLENLFDTLKAGEVKSVNVIIKADVQGSVEALSASLQKIEVEGVKITIVHSAVGAINESDVTLAEASNAFIIGFNVRPTSQARQQAEADDVEIRLHSIIYKVIEEMEEAMKGMLDPEFEEKIIGEALIRETFKVSKVGTIGGFMVISGKVTRDSKVRVIRDGVVIYDGELASLKHYKDDVKEVTNGREGGLMIDGYNDIKMDDVIEAYVMEEIKR